MKRKLLISILSILCMLCCAFGFASCNKAFDLTFVVDGATYATLEVKEEEPVSFPENPTKTNHTFNGWFLDDGVWERPFNEETVEATPITDNLTVYAKFTLNTIDGVTFEGATYTYDGNEKTIAVQNLPDGANISYSPSNIQTDAGSYEITATITKENHESKQLTATLLINEATMNVTFADKRALAGTSTTIEATGYPEDATVTYTNAGPYSAKGTYEIGVKIERENYVTYEKTATLTLVNTNEVLTAKYLAGHAGGSGYPATYYLCVVEFIDNYTKANLYATKYNTKGKETDYFKNATVDISFTTEGKLRIVAQYSDLYNWVRMIENDYGEFKTDYSFDNDYCDRVVAKGFTQKPTLTAYTGRYELDLSSYEAGQTFAPSGWSEQVMNSETGTYEASSGNATIIDDNGTKRIAVKIGENENNVYKYTYMFSETPLGQFSFRKFHYNNAACVRVRFITKSGGSYYVFGSKTKFYDGSCKSDDYDWLDTYGSQRGNIVGIEIEVYKGTYYNSDNTIEIAPFILSYSLDV